MNWIKHEYLVPVFLGNGKETIESAKALRRVTGARPQIFASKFELFQGIRFDCRRVSPWRDELLLISLIDFARELEEYKYPVIIYGEDTKDFILSNTKELESRFEMFSCFELMTLLKEKNNDI